MCGIVGLFTQQRVAEELYESLINLQHRGQDAAGIITCHQRFDVLKSLGLVRDIFNKDNLAELQGSMGLGHTRYPTAGGYSKRDVQPIWLGNPRGIALAHNGNLVNYKSLYEELTQTRQKHFSSSIDSELLLHLLSDGIEKHENLDFFECLCQAVRDLFDKAQGSFSVVSMILGKGLCAFRDPHGIKPLAIGERTHANGKKEYIFASETSMFQALNFQLLGDVQAGELVYVDPDGALSRRKLMEVPLSPCAFEYVYFSRPDSTLDEISVYQARIRMGQLLAKKWLLTYPGILPDVIIPAPYTSNTAAISFAEVLGVRYREGLYKNNFIGRTFIMADENGREQSIRHKLSAHSSEIDGKKVLILDDSIVRGSTSKKIVTMIREYGATEVFLASACPPIINPCFYGIDIPSRTKLIAAQKTEEDLREFFNVDRLIYQNTADLKQAIIGEKNCKINQMCMACMDGNYIAGRINEQKMQSLENERYVCTGEL